MIRYAWTAALIGCIELKVNETAPVLDGKDVMLTILHTSDIHSRLLPYSFEPSFTDQSLGLQMCEGESDCTDGVDNDDNGAIDCEDTFCERNDPACGESTERPKPCFGGIARISHILKREREKSARVLHLDSGDSFQGAIIFNEFDGEAEMKLLSEIGLDAAVVANHEFDKGARNLSLQYGSQSAFKLLAANYDFEDWSHPWSTELEKMITPSAIYDLQGLRVGIIGLGNISSLNSIYDESNSMGVKVFEPGDAIVAEASKLREQGVDVVGIVSHMGMDDDQEQALEFADIDFFIGGHHHVAIDPPLVITNEETGKRIPVVHSGAFAKFVGRIDMVIRDGRVLSHDYTLFPVDRQVPEDPFIVDILEEYQDALDEKYNTSQVLAYAEQKLTRYGFGGGDSMLGNFTAEAMRFYPGVETEIALTNTLGIRADIPPGPITVDALFNSMPFDNTITTMFLSGREVKELLDYVSNRSTDRGCSSQAQVAGITFDMVCDPFFPSAESIYINGRPLDLNGTYELATNNYIANGGSGFEVLERNTTQFDTGISIRDVVKDALIRYATLPIESENVCVEDGRINTVY